MTHTRNNATSRKGLTLLEVLVVFAIASVGIVIFVPLLVEAREKTRQVTCQSQMGRVTRAILQFESLRGALPAGSYLNDVRFGQGACPQVGMETHYGNTHVVNGCFDIFGRNGGPNYSWVTTVLPYLDLGSLHDQIDFSKTAQEHFSENSSAPTSSVRQNMTPVFAREIRQLICPADGGPKAHYSGVAAIGFAAHQVAERGGFAKTNYAGFTSVVHIDHFTSRQGALGGFSLGTPVGQPLAAIKDGLAQTVLLSEVRTLNATWDSRGAWGLAFPGATLLAVDWHAVDGNHPDYVPDPDYSPDDIALPNSLTYRDVVVGVRAPNVPTTVQAAMPAVPFANGGAFLGAAPRSQHGRAVGASLLDGQVRFISNDVDPLVFAWLVYPRDGQTPNPWLIGSPLR